MTSPTLARKARLKTHLVSFNARLRQHATLRRAALLAAASASAFLFLLTLRTLKYSSHARTSLSSPAAANTRQCAKLPAPVAEALVHYATTSANADATSSAQQTAPELAVTARALARRAPCNVLAFGGLGGRESALWAALNHGGRTVFLEEDASLIAETRSRHPGLGIEPHQAAYQTTLADAEEVLALRGSPGCTTSTTAGNHPLSPDEFESSECKLAMRGLPAAFYETEWDVIIVDAPRAWVPEAPGRIGGAIYMAGMAARARSGGTTTEVVVHDVDRAVEDGLSMAFLCRGYLQEEVGRVRRFAVPSHRDKDGMPFCP